MVAHTAKARFNMLKVLGSSLGTASAGQAGQLKTIDPNQQISLDQLQLQATTTASGATVLHHALGAVGQVTAAGGSQQQQPKFVFNVDAAAPNGRSADVDSVRQAPAGQQSAAAAAAVPGGYQFEAIPAPASTQYPAGNVVQERQIDVDSETDSNHDTALPQACAGGNEELVELLIIRGQKGFYAVDLCHNHTVVALILAGHEKVVETLLRHEAKMEAQSECTKDTPLSLACSGGRYQVGELLLNMNANRENRNVTDYTPLSLATSGGYVKNIKLLLSHGTEINSQTGSKLGIFPSSSRPAAEDKNKKGKSPLWLAANGDHLAVVGDLCNAGADIDSQENRKMSSLMAAFRKDHTKVVKWMVNHERQKAHKGRKARTAAQTSRRRSRKECEKKYRFHLSKVPEESVDNQGPANESPAFRSAWFEVVLALLQHTPFLAAGRSSTAARPSDATNPMPTRTPLRRSTPHADPQNRTSIASPSPVTRRTFFIQQFQCFELFHFLAEPGQPIGALPQHQHSNPRGNRHAEPVWRFVNPDSCPWRHFPTPSCQSALLAVAQFFRPMEVDLVLVDQAETRMETAGRLFRQENFDALESNGRRSQGSSVFSRLC
ncbi:conserved hypothetical protein [Culex quinquefasciatus]|uniref:Uncharacterized protein n=1 Tax=Culex quinquefasciatus TaxID=7176 RepID=B0X1V2_CULQU|nr:conserved hypothetical protein [Culex quinquefasciatus]|eukprot:XP_001863624.1 conserved hypothetical protein [Culex quinquefasciatus]